MTTDPHDRSDVSAYGDTPAPSSAIGHVFTIALGVLGWAAVVLPPVTGIWPAEPVSALPVLLFVAVILAARALAFRLVKGSVLSLDSAYYVAAALSVGFINAGRLVAFSLTLDAAVRLFDSRRRGRGAGDNWWTELGYVLYFGGMSAGLLVVFGRIFGADDHVSQASAVAWRVVAIATSFLVAHYAIQGARLRLLGRPWSAYWKQLALPGIAAEASLMPIGVVLVLLYDPDQPLGFLLLSLTYLLINYVFARLSRASAELAGRVHELEILNATARRLSSSLQLEELVEAVARETCRAVPEAEAVSLVHPRASGDPGLVIDGFDKPTERFFRRPLAQGEGATGWVMKHGVARRIDDLTTADVSLVGGGTQGIRSWLGVPLFLYGECAGVVAVHSTHPDVFRAEHQRILESLALQIAAALQNAHLYELAMVDGLTGLFMRRYFDARIEEEIERSKRYGTPFSVVMMDVDDFKHLNDTYGHLIGDRVLRAIANVVKSQMRGVDTAARYGGEEIAVILPRTEMVTAYNVGERIRAAIAEQRITTDTDPPRALSVTASFGIAAYPESKAVDGEDLVRRADRALYRAKKTGKNRVELFWSDDSGPARLPSMDDDEEAG